MNKHRSKKAGTEILRSYYALLGSRGTDYSEWLLKGFNNMAMTYHRVKRFTDAEIVSLRGREYYLIGEKDPFQTLGGRSIMDKYNMNARYYPSAGHGLNHELPDEVNAELIEGLG